MFNCTSSHHWSYCKPGFIYVAMHEDLCKIGCTRETSSTSGVEKRLYALRKNTGKDFYLKHLLYFSPCIKSLETSLHNKFSEYRIGKEEIFTSANIIDTYIKNLKYFNGIEVIHIKQNDGDSQGERA